MTSAVFILGAVGLVYLAHAMHLDSTILAQAGAVRAAPAPLKSEADVRARMQKREERLEMEQAAAVSADYPDAEDDPAAAEERTRTFEAVAEMRKAEGEAAAADEGQHLEQREHAGEPVGVAAGRAASAAQGLSGRRPSIDGMDVPPNPEGEARCDDSCAFANDGVCDDGSTVAKDEGGSTPHRDIKCDLGTDCTDCGALPYPMNTRRCVENPDTPELCDNPVKLIKDHDVNLRAVRTRTEPSFIQPYTDPKADVDVSERMENKRIVEDSVVHIWRASTKKCCASGRGVVIDVGANFGMFTAYSAMLGCEVIAFEPVPLFRAFVRYNLQANGISHKVHLRPRVASNEDGRKLAVTVPQAGIWGTAGVNALNVDPAIKDPKQFKVSVPTERVGTVLSALYPDADAVDICMFKVDVEGFEPEVFDGAREVFARYKPRNVMMEYTPGVYERSGDWNTMYKFPAMLYRFLQHRYIVRHLLLKEQAVLDFDGPVPSLPIISNSTIMHDIRDAARMSAGEIRGMPWPIHPDSLHGHFGHNTDVWATIEEGFERRDDEHELYMDENSEYGLAARRCVDLYRFAPQREVEGCLCQKDKAERREKLQAAKQTRENSGNKALQRARWWEPLRQSIAEEVAEADRRGH